MKLIILVLFLLVFIREINGQILLQFPTTNKLVVQVKK